jgi:peptidoglycan/xylan/chitin deacetylase (PgdA/CDA1 family)
MARRVILGFAVFAFCFFLGGVWFYPWLALALLCFSHLLVLFPTLVANCQWWGPVITSFETAQREIWLTIDDGPDPIHTPRMLALLDRFHAQATFFVIGERALKFPAELAQIRAAGHQVANHTFSHPSGSFWALPSSRIAAEIDRCPETSEFFRAPAGLKNFCLHPLLARRGMRLIGWTVRGLDTLSRDPEKVAERIRKALKPGAIVLLHEGRRTARAPDFHPRCLELTLSALTTANYRCILPGPEQLRPRAAEK